MKTIKLTCVIITTVCASLSYPNEINTDSFWGRVDFLTEYYFEQDLQTFSNHKNNGFRDKYLMSAQTMFQTMLISYDDFLHFGLLYISGLGMGRQNEAILFDPQEVGYSIIPFFEYRRNKIFFQTGLDHSCFHEVDRLTRPTAYWNKAYIRASSANYRYQQMKIHYIDEGRTGYLDNLRWSAWAGYFIREFGGMDVTLLSGGHPWSATAGVDAGYSFYRTKSWMFSGRNQIEAFADTAGTGYWAGVLGIEADVYNRKHSFGVFINYNYEFPGVMPLFSKDQLIEFGIRFRY